MAITTTIDAVTTGDAAPTAAPNRISARPGKDSATFTFTPTDSGGAKILAVRIVDGGVSAYTGTVVGRKGLVCSDSEPCSDSLPCSDWDSPSGTQLSEDVTYAEEAANGTPTEGTHQVNVWVCAVGQVFQ